MEISPAVVEDVPTTMEYLFKMVDKNIFRCCLECSHYDQAFVE